MRDNANRVLLEGHILRNILERVIPPASHYRRENSKVVMRAELLYVGQGDALGTIKYRWMVSFAPSESAPLAESREELLTIRSRLHALVEQNERNAVVDSIVAMGIPTVDFMLEESESNEGVLIVFITVHVEVTR